MSWKGRGYTENCGRKLGKAEDSRKENECFEEQIIVTEYFLDRGNAVPTAINYVPELPTIYKQSQGSNQP